MSASAIEWTDDVWNPATGCDRVSPGCAHCYARELAPRLRAMGNRKYQHVRDGGSASGPAFGVTLHPEVLEQPLRWRKPRRVFVNSMSDLFHDEIPFEYIAAVFGVMSAAADMTFQVLTKRPDRMLEFFAWYREEVRERECREQPGEVAIQEARRAGVFEGYLIGDAGEFWPLPNVWLGVTIENRRFIDRADLLRETPAAVRFISAEPLLGRLDPDIGFCGTCDAGAGAPDPRCEECEGVGHWPIQGSGLDLGEIDRLIVGGESGARHRPVDVEWIRGLRDLAEMYDTAFFFKQWGGRTPKAGGRELDGRTHDEMPRGA